MRVVDKIDKMRVQRGWSFYKLAQETGLTQQAIQQWIEGKAQPSLKALESISEAYGVTLAELVSECAIVEMTPENEHIYEKWQLLTKDEKIALEMIIDNLINKRRG